MTAVALRLKAGEVQVEVASVSRHLHLSWDAVDGIMGRAVARGLARRQITPPRRIGVDETSFQKRHEYVTVVCDLERDRVLHVADERTEASLAGFYEELGPAACADLEVVALDMWRPYIAATRRYVPEADRKLAFDKFHVFRLLGHAVDLVRRAEHRALEARGEATLAGARYWWLTNPERMDAQRWQAFRPLRGSTDGARVDAKGAGQQPVVVRAARLGRQGMGGMAGPGAAASAGADAEGGGDDQEVSVGHPQCGHQPGDRRLGGRNEFADSAPQAPGLRLSQSGTVSRGNPFSIWADLIFTPPQSTVPT